MNIRRTAKACVFATGLLIAAVPIAIVWLEKRLPRAEGFFGMFAQWFALIPGAPGAWIRGAYYYGTLDSCDWEVHVGFGTLFTHRGVRLEKHVSTGAYCVIGHATIGARVRVASRVSIPSGKRQHFDDTGALSDVTRYECVHVGSDSWIGEGAVLLADVGERAIVSAGAVVVNPMPGACIVGGNPARMLRDLRLPKSDRED